MLNKFTTFHVAAAIGMSLLAAHTALGFEPQELESIRAAAERAVRTQAVTAATEAVGDATLRLQAAPLDPRLRVAACDRDLTGAITNGGQVRAQTTVGVRCEGQVRWTVYTSVSVESETTVLIARRALPRDAEVTAADFTVETRWVPGFASAYVRAPAALAGQRLGRGIGAGEALAAEVLAPANLIHRGQQVVLLAHAGGLEVRMTGIALGDGRASQRIRVQNQSSQRVVEGVVLSSNEIEIPL